MAQILPDVRQTGDPLWYCLRALPKREHIAATALRRELDLSCFAPRLRYRKLTTRGPVWFIEAMFPGYLFSKFVYREVHRRVSSTPAVQCIVRFGEYVPTLNNDAITILRQRAGDDELITVDPEIRAGDSVRVSEGPLQGLLGLVTRVVPAKERVRLLLEFLGRQIETEVEKTKVIFADKHLRR